MTTRATSGWDVNGRRARSSIGTPRMDRNCFGSSAGGPAPPPSPAPTTTTPPAGREPPRELTPPPHPPPPPPRRSEKNTSELQSPFNLVCRLLLLKKKKQ